MANKYTIDLERRIEEKDRQSLIDLLSLISGATGDNNVEYVEDDEKIKRFGSIADYFKLYFSDMPNITIKSSIDEERISGLITITAENVLDLRLTDEIKLLISNCTRMDISPRNNGVIELDFNFLGFKKRRAI